MFHDFQVEDLHEGLTVIHGPNEAGKSTLLAFVRGVLFGFPDKRAKTGHYPPLAGGKHGGRMTVRTKSGEFVIIRRAGRNLPPSVVLPSGDEGDATTLAALIGSADDQLFRSIFAFSLTELQTLDSLSADGIRDRIFSAGIAGAGRSARDAAAALGTEAVALFRPRGKSALGTLLLELKELDVKIRAAQAQTLDYDKTVERAAALAKQASELRQKLRRARERQARAARLAELWPTWRAAQETRQRLADLGATLPAVDDSETLATEKQSLVQSRALHEDRLAQARDLEPELDEGQLSLARQLRRLGVQSDARRLAAFDLSIPRIEEARGWRTRLEEADQAVQACRSKLATVTQRRDDLLANLRRSEKEHTGTTPPAPAHLEAVERGLRQLRAARGEYQELQSALDGQRLELKRSRAAARTLLADTRWAPPLWLEVVTWLAVAAPIAHTVRFWERQTPWLDVLVALSLLALGYVVHQIRVHAAEHNDDRRQEARELQGAADDLDATIGAKAARLEALSETLAREAQPLSLSPIPTALELEERHDQLAREQQARARFEQVAGRLTEERNRLVQLTRAIGRAEDSLVESQTAQESATAAFTRWKEELEVPGALHPRAVLDFFDAVRAAQQTHQQLEESNRRLGTLRAEIATWENRARSWIGAVAGSAPEDEGPALVEHLNAKTESYAEWRALTQQVQSLEQQLTARAGSDKRARDLTQELGRGRLEAWRKDERLAQDAIHTLEATREEVVRQHENCLTEQSHIESSADLPSLHTDRHALIAEITRALHRWQTITVARALINDTLREFERSRQPAVLTHASELFADITDGRYQAVVAESESARLLALTEQGARRAVEELSRGTAEQLYLCLRLGLAAEFAKRSTELPLVMDDVLVNFDPDRAEATARVLAKAATSQQLLFFTCHPHVRDLLASAAGGGCHVVELPRSGVGAR